MNSQREKTNMWVKRSQFFWLNPHDFLHVFPMDSNVAEPQLRWKIVCMSATCQCLRSRLVRYAVYVSATNGNILNCGLWIRTTKYNQIGIHSCILHEPAKETVWMASEIGHGQSFLSADCSPGNVSLSLYVHIYIYICVHILNVYTHMCVCIFTCGIHLGIENQNLSFQGERIKWNIRMNRIFSMYSSSICKSKIIV